ncbi:hypothetical protein YC2023_116861 [Brassica napus]
MDRLSPQQATTTNGSAYSTLEPPKASHPIICKKLHSLFNGNHETMNVEGDFI